MTCDAPTEVEGGYGCPRECGHGGPHYWWLAWEDGAGRWRVTVYSGTPYDRIKRCNGTFSAPPSAADVHQLLLTLAPFKRREQARRTPHSEPQPRWRMVVVEGEAGVGRV